MTVRLHQQTSTKTCPVCGHGSALEQTCRDADLYRCPECDHCFSDPSSLRAVEEYGPDYFEKQWFQSRNTGLFDNISNTIAMHNRNASVLDVGCGNGAFLRHIHQTNPSFTLTGIDLSKNESGSGSGIEFLQGDFMSMALSRQFDVVVSLAVIEHLRDVRAFVTRVYSLCAPGGLVIVMTMNDRSLLYGTARLLKRIGFNLPADQLYSAHHLNHFNVTSLHRLMGSCGLQPDKTILHNIPMGGVDISSRSRLVTPVLQAGVWGLFGLGRLTGRTYLQTVICRKPTH